MSQAALQELLDRQAISEVFNAYVNALDYKRWSDLEELFTPDATASWFEGAWHQSSREEIIGFIRSFIEKVQSHHILGNYSAAIDGDRATGSCRVRAHHAGMGDRSHLFHESLSHFAGELVRHNGQWRFVRFTEQLMVTLGTNEVFA